MSFYIKYNIYIKYKKKSWEVFRHVWQLSKHETLTQCWINAGQASATLTEQ